MTGPWRKPRKWNIPLIYAPKIPGVIDGTIQQTIRVGRKFRSGINIIYFTTLYIY